MQEMFCPRCGAPIQDPCGKYCTACDAPLPGNPVRRGLSRAAFGIAVLVLAAACLAAVFPVLTSGTALPQEVPAVNGTPGPAGPAVTRPAAAATVSSPLPAATPVTALTTPVTGAAGVVLPDRPGTVITRAVTKVPLQPSVESYTNRTPGAPFIDPASLEARVHVLINERREENGLAPLVYDPFLASVARGYSRDMAERGFFAHEDPDGKSTHDRGNEAGYPCIRVIGEYVYSGISENLFMGHRAGRYFTNGNGEVVLYEWNSEESLAERAVDGWMNSTGHRTNILTPHFAYEGVGVAFSDNDRVYITENFC